MKWLSTGSHFLELFGLAVWTGGLLVVLCLTGFYTGGVLTPRIESARAALHQEISGSADEIFGRLHQRSERLASVALIAGLGLLFLKANRLSQSYRGGETGSG